MAWFRNNRITVQRIFIIVSWFSNYGMVDYEIATHNNDDTHAVFSSILVTHGHHQTMLAMYIHVCIHDTMLAFVA